MVDRQKDFYQQQLAQAAWANFRGASGYNPATAHAGFAGPGGGAMGGHPNPAPTNPYENYMQQLQQFASSQANPAMFGGSNFLGNGTKDMSPGFTSPFGFPPGHPMHFPGISNYRPLPAHSPLPAHVKNSAGPTTPLPAHMRSSPYQQSNYHTPPYSYQMGQGVAGYGHPNPHPPPDQRQTQYDPSQVSAAQFSKSAPPSRSSSQDPTNRRQPGLPNGSSVAGAGGVPGLLPPTDVSSAYTQLQQLTAAYSQAATASVKEIGKKAAPPTTNNNYPPYPYPASTTTTSSAPSYPNSSLAGGPSGAPGSSGGPGGSGSGAGGGDPSYDQIAAALLNRFSGQFSPQLLMEMERSKSGQQGQSYQSVPGFPSLAQSKEQPKQPAKAHPTQSAPKAQPEPKADTVKADRRPPDPGPGTTQLNGPVSGKLPTPQGYVLPNIPRPTSSQLYPGYSPDQSGPPSAGLNSSGHSNDSHLSICSPPPSRGQAHGQDGLPGGQSGGGGGGHGSLPGGHPGSGCTPTYLSNSSISPSPAVSSPASSQTLSPGQPPGPHSPSMGQHQFLPVTSHQSPPAPKAATPTPILPVASPLTDPSANQISQPRLSTPPPKPDLPAPSSKVQPVDTRSPPRLDTPPGVVTSSSAGVSPSPNTVTNHKLPTPKAGNLPLAHSVASQLSSPAPSFGLAGLASMTSKIKDLQSRQAAAKQVGSTSKASEDRSELKGLWKMQAEFQKKNKAKSNSNSCSPLASPAPPPSSKPSNAPSTPTPPPSTSFDSSVGPSKAKQSQATPKQSPVLTPVVSTTPAHSPALQSFPVKPPPTHYTPLTVPTPPISSYNNSPYPKSNPQPSQAPPHMNFTQVPQSAPGTPLYQPPYHGGPPLLHTPRSPPHPPPPRPAQQSYSHIPSGPPSLPSGPEHSHAYNPVLQPQPSFSTSSQHSYFPPSMSPQAPYHPPPYLPSVPPQTVKSYQPISPPENPKYSKSYDAPPLPVPPAYPNQNDRMEIKNSGIPGPSAITWKRKSVEDSPTSLNKAKKRKIVASQDTVGDPYSFDEEERPTGSSQTVKSVEQSNGGGASVGPVYKYKSALLSREPEPENLSPPVLEVERGDIGESDESSRSSGGNISPVKKKNKRPKLEEWSVNKDAKVSIKDLPGKVDSGDKSEKGEADKSNNGVRKGPLWGLPVVPKPPVKPIDKPREKLKSAPLVTEPVNTEPVQPSHGGCNNKAPVNSNVWLQAFGAGSAKPKKKVVSEPVSRNGAKKSLKAEKVERESVLKPTSILDIPPEVRRKPRPVFGGLIHFSPDWSRAVRRHHERCRVPPAIENSGVLKPKILAGQLTPKKSYEDFARKDMVSPPDLLAIERERIERTAVAHTTLPDPVTASTEDELPGQLPSIVETILENRKKLREAAKMGRMYKIPFMKEKKKRMMRQPVPDESQDVALGLLPTPGLPLLTEDTKEVLVGSGFGNFRRYTLLKYLDSLNEAAGDQKPKWNPDVLDIKPRRQSILTKPVTSLKEIFGLDAPPKKVKKVVERVTTPVDTVSRASTPVSVKKDKKKKTSAASRVASPSPVPKEKKFVPKERQATSKLAEEPDDGAYSQEVGDPSEEDNSLQAELGGFALDLLEDNPSWSKQVTIQNLVIWEPAEQPEVAKKKKGKKKRTKKSGLDFQSHKRKSKSTNISRAGSPSGEEVHDIEYTLDNVVAESSRWVIDKNAGETILHRASKMGYPDVVAYAVDMMEMAPMEKDYAGLTPLHKAAFKGHETIVKVLLSYGADASAGVKGTRALHEAIEGASPSTARTLLAYGADPLLHDYSGNMPLDLSLNDPTMQLYITNLLADLHGKTPAPAMRSNATCSPPVRWNVSHYPDFHQPGPNILTLEQEKEAANKSKVEEMFSFEATSHPLPPTYQFRDRPGDWVLYRDLKDYTKKYCQGKVDVRTKGDLLELKKSEFLRTSHCSLLDRKAVEVRFHAREQEDIVILVKVDKFVRKIFNSEVVMV